MFKRSILGLLALALTMFALPAGTATAATPPKVAIVGDSFTAGWNGTTRNQSDAWWNYTARSMNWQVSNVVANPGAGYWTWGWYGTIYESLRDHPIARDTDFLLLQAGLNDSGRTGADVGNVVRSVNDVINLAKWQAPGITVIVIGMFVPGQQGMTPSQLNIARRLGDYEAIHDNRYMIAAMCTFEVSGDGSHPTNLGHRQIGDWVSWHLANNLGGNGQPLRWNGSSFVV